MSRIMTRKRMREDTDLLDVEAWDTPRRLSDDDLHIHDLRRTLGSWLASSGTSLPIIGRVLNHKTPEATKVYARLIVAPVRNAMEEATSAMTNAATYQRKD